MEHMQQTVLNIDQRGYMIYFQFSCCGVDSFSDWRNLSSVFNDATTVVPESCCTGLTDDAEASDALVYACVRRPWEERFSMRTRGCFAEFERSYRANERGLSIAVVAIVGAMVGQNIIDVIAL